MPNIFLKQLQEDLTTESEELEIELTEDEQLELRLDLGKTTLAARVECVNRILASLDDLEIPEEAAAELSAALQELDPEAVEDALDAGNESVGDWFKSIGTYISDAVSRTTRNMRAIGDSRQQALNYISDLEELLKKKGDKANNTTVKVGKVAGEYVIGPKGNIGTAEDLKAFMGHIGLWTDVKKVNSFVIDLMKTWAKVRVSLDDNKSDQEMYDEFVSKMTKESPKHIEAMQKYFGATKILGKNGRGLVLLSSDKDFMAFTETRAIKFADLGSVSPQRFFPVLHHNIEKEPGLTVADALDKKQIEAILSVLKTMVTLDKSLMDYKATLDSVKKMGMEVADSSKEGATVIRNLSSWLFTWTVDSSVHAASKQITVARAMASLMVDMAKNLEDSE